MASNEFTYSSYFCSSMSKVPTSSLLIFFQDFIFVFNFMQFECDIRRYRFFCLSCLIFSELPESVVLRLSLVLGNSQSLLLKIVLLLFFSFSLCYSNYTYVTPFVISPQFLHILSFLFSFFFSLYILVWEIFIDISLSSLILSTAISSLLCQKLSLFCLSF